MQTSAANQGDKSLQPKSMFEATAEANNLSAVASAKEIYSTLMGSAFGGTKPFMPTAKLEKEHSRIKQLALEQFQGRKKMGGEEFSAKYKRQLEEDIDKLFENFRAQNESKDPFRTARTPATLITISAICYVLWGIFILFGMYSFANMCNRMIGVNLLVLAVWGYVRFSGEMQDIGSHIDTGASALWGFVLRPTYIKLAEMKNRMQEN